MAKEKDFMKKIFEKIRCHFLKVLTIKTSPHAIALGFAISTFILIFPTLGVAVPIVIIVTLTYPKINKIAALAAVAVWNPFVTIPLYGLSYKLGYALLPNIPPLGLDMAFIDRIYSLSLRFLVGNSIFAVILSLASYIIIRTVATLYQRRLHPPSEIKKKCGS